MDMQLIPAIEWLGSVGSTNEEAMLRARRGQRGPLWIAAEEQTAGRGRSGRNWVSRPGNLYASLLLTFSRPLATVPQLSLVAGLAAHEAISRLAPNLPFRLKWPNDVLVDGAKVCGILIEGRMNPQSTAHNVVVGIGVNLAHHPDVAGRPATSLAAFGVPAGPRLALSRLSAAFEHWRKVWDEGEGMPAIREAWLERALAIGLAVSVNTGPERIEGRFQGLDADGAMLLGLPSGDQRRITFGDVHIAAPPGAST